MFRYIISGSKRKTSTLTHTGDPEPLVTMECVVESGGSFYRILRAWWVHAPRLRPSTDRPTLFKRRRVQPIVSIPRRLTLIDTGKQSSRENINVVILEWKGPSETLWVGTSGRRMEPTDLPGSVQGDFVLRTTNSLWPSDYENDRRRNMPKVCVVWMILLCEKFLFTFDSYFPGEKVQEPPSYWLVSVKPS